MAFSKFGLKACISEFTGPTRAVRCYEKCGFRKEGVVVRASRSGPIEIVLMSASASELASNAAAS